MSKLETNTIDTVSGTSTLQVGSTNTTTITLGVSGDTINVPSGVTIANSGTATGFGGANTPAFCAYRNYNNGGYQSIGNNSFTKCAFNAEYWDTASEFDSSTNYRWTAGTAGKYVIGTNIIIDNLADGAALLVSIYKNGSAVGTNAQGLNGIVNSSNGNPDQCQVISTIDVASGDYFEVYVKHTHGGSRDWRTEYGNVFYAHKLIGV